MEPAGAERHRRRPPQAMSCWATANQSNQRVEEEPRCPTKPSEILEAGAGIEPANSGFADRDLTTWLPRRFAREMSVPCGGQAVNALA